MSKTQIANPCGFAMFCGPVGVHPLRIRKISCPGLLGQTDQLNTKRKETTFTKQKDFQPCIVGNPYLLGLLRIVSANGLVRFPYIVSSSPRIALIIHPCGFLARCAWSRLSRRKSAKVGRFICIYASAKSGAFALIPCGVKLYATIR